MKAKGHVPVKCPEPQKSISLKALLSKFSEIWLFHRCVNAEAYPPFGGSIVNITSKQATPVNTRVTVCPSKMHLAEFERTVGGLVPLRRFSEQLGWRKSLGHCSGFARGYAKCDYYDLCHGYPQTSIDEWKQLALDDQLPTGYKGTANGA